MNYLLDEQNGIGRKLVQNANVLTRGAKGVKQEIFSP